MRPPREIGAILEVEGLVKRYGDVTVLDGVSFAIEPGQIFGLLGPNGAGKTTTISIISAMLRPNSGSVRIGGYDVRKQTARIRPLMGIVPQEIGLYPVLNARENIEYFGGIMRLRGTELRRRTAEALDLAGLAEYANKPQVRYFSGGMLRRLNLAAGVVHHPRLLLLDEPTSGVDAQSRNMILENIKKLSREEGIAVLYTTHYMEEAENLCDVVAIMDHGRILVCDDVKRLVSSASGTIIEVTLTVPATGFAAALREMPGISDVVEQDELRYTVQAADQARGLGAVVGVAGQQAVAFEELRVVPPSLEQVFLSLTGREMRDRTGE